MIHRTRLATMVSCQMLSGWMMAFPLIACVIALAVLINQSPTLAAGVNSAAAVIHSTAGPQESGGLSDDAIDSVGEKVMNGNDFRSVRRRVLENVPEAEGDKGFLLSVMGMFGDFIDNVFRAIGDFITWLMSGFRSSGGTAPAAPASPPASTTFGGMGDEISAIVTTIAIIAIVAILMVLIAMIIKSIDEKKRRQNGLLSDSDDMLSDVVTPPGDIAVSTYESRAIQLAGAGDFRAAIRELLLGSMSWIERAGHIRYRKGLTNRDYLRAIWRRDEKRTAYLNTASQFELVFFGRRVPTAEMFEQCLTSFRGSFREEETPTAAV